MPGSSQLPVPGQPCQVEGTGLPGSYMEQRVMSVTSGLSAALPLTRACAHGASPGGQTCQGSGVRGVPVSFLPMGLLAGQKDAVRCPQVLVSSLLAVYRTAWSPARPGGGGGAPDIAQLHRAGLGARQHGQFSNQPDILSTSQA